MPRKGGGHSCRLLRRARRRLQRRWGGSARARCSRCRSRRRSRMRAGHRPAVKGRRRHRGCRTSPPYLESWDLRLAAGAQPPRQREADAKGHVRVGGAPCRTGRRVASRVEAVRLEHGHRAVGCGLGREGAQQAQGSLWLFEGCCFGVLQSFGELFEQVCGGGHLFGEQCVCVFSVVCGVVSSGM